LVAHTIRCAIVFVLASAGIMIAINSAMRGSATAGTQIPAIARPLPFNCPRPFPILTNATIPKIIAGIAVTRQVKGLKMPSTRAAIASPLVLASAIGGRGTLVRAQLQNWHSWALSGFWVPHFGQFILLPFRFYFN
jgi:hypothetical protein